MILSITMNPAIDKVYAINDFKVNKVFRPHDMTATAGGKGLNVARVLNIINEPVIASGLLGGSTGDFILEQINEHGIDNDFVKISKETRICINIMDKKNTTSTEILESGPIISKAECKLFLNKFKKLLCKCNIITASGSLPEGLPVNFYFKLIKIAKEKKFILDTSGKYLIEGIKAKPYMIKPNREEFEYILKNKLNDLNDYRRGLVELRNRGIKIPLVTLGRDGCITLANGSIYRFYSPQIDVVNTVGSGDAFVSGCAAMLNKDKDILEVIRMGMAFAIANTQFFKTGMVSQKYVDKYFEKIKIEKVTDFNKTI